MKNGIVATALQTIQLEAKSIADLAGFLDPSFPDAIELLNNCKGRLVFSGIGKSALIAQKIVATLNSTGTPSLFMHAADAIHGDLGVVQKDDIVLILSKSGESPEIKALVPYIKNFGNKLIAVVGNTSSYLANEADFILNTTVSSEACPNNLAPTSSTTAQLVMGDVIAVCLMQLKGFTSADFGKYHPGGNLGKRLFLKVADVTSQDCKPAVSPSTKLKDVIVEITKNRMGTAVVLNNEHQIVGIITDGDLRRMLEKTVQIETVTAADIMSSTPQVIDHQTLAVEAIDKMKQNEISQLVVTKEGNYYGILHIHELIKEGLI
ncbi:MAG: KpsF/GutQ family sugar-phosphate isomerase [Bacteroidetes bacterium]|jgi:arabinose-5-phosphate isomerase|nr:KpsF/GutQ family sugar-phosphate isomerase [Bacteroidota bacterium]